MPGTAEAAYAAEAAETAAAEARCAGRPGVEMTLFHFPSNVLPVL